MMNHIKGTMAEGARERRPPQEKEWSRQTNIPLETASLPQSTHSVPNYANSPYWPDDIAEVNAYRQVHDFWDANSDVIAPRMRCLAIDNPEIDSKTIEETINGYSDASRTLLKGLTALGQLHPFVAVAVGAFALIITMDLTRRDNDRKIMAVKAQMQDLMSALFELRRVKSPEDAGPDGVTIAQRLSGLMEEISDDIKACGSACDAYLKKGFLAKTVKSGKYELRLAGYAEKFMEHTKRFKMSLAVHTAIEVDKTNQKLDIQTTRLQEIEGKLNMLLLFQKLDTPREKGVKRFMKEHGGAKVCIDNDELLEELIARSGEPCSKLGGRDSGRKANDLPEMRKKLRKELQEDVDEAFSRNMVLFERKLDIQSKQLTETIQEESEHIIHTLLAGAHDRILDPDLQKIWKDMGWKGSVKARHFVLALHDYYIDRLNETESSTPPRTPLSSTPSGQRKSIVASRKKQDDRWALAYINAAYVQPISEAVDDDGTGFVSVKEVNTFVSERPEGWSLSHWIAYWAVGWQASMSRYKNEIYELVRTMFQTLKHTLPSNRRAVDEYLFHASFWRIELLLRSTRSVNPQIYSDPDLIKMTEAYTKSEEERLDVNLQSVGYELDTPATVSLVTGVGRIERYVFPLIYLLLRRHLKVMFVACKHVVDTEEFVALNDSLVSILLAIDYRVQGLEAIFKQTHLDVQARLGNFAFGIFQLSYGDIRRIPINNTFGTWVNDEDPTKTAGQFSLPEIKAEVAKWSLDSILKYGIKDGFQSTDYFEFQEHHLKHIDNAIQGTWTGHCQRQGVEDSFNHVIRISIRLLPDQCTMVGKGEDYAETFEFQGQVNAVNTGYDFSFEISDDTGPSRTCYGTLHAETDIIYANWRTTKKSECGEPIPDLAFELRRTPPSLVRYRYTPDQFAEDPVRSRWSFACSAALHQAQERMWARKFFEARFTERKKFVELTIRALIVDLALTPQNPLNLVETRELEYLRQELDPSEARFYQALAEFEIQKLPWHPAWGCDWCERRITRCRILCVQCMAEDLSDNIDLCAVCIERIPSKRGFTHELSHTVVKVEQTLHDFEFAKTVESARVTSERIKSFFRSMDAMSMHGEAIDTTNESGQQDGMPSIPVCVSCQKRVTPPCWVCCVCSRDTFVCQDCDTKRIPPPPTSNHALSHALVRIRDWLATGESASVEERMLVLEHRVLALEHKLTEGLSSLEAKYEESINSIESRIDQRISALEKRVEDKFTRLEDVLQLIATQTAALPALYGQVVRDFYTKSSTVREV